MKNIILTREIVRHILVSFGIAPKPHWGKVGLTLNEFKKNKVLSIEYDDGKVINHPVFAAQIKVSDDSTLKLLLVDLSLEESSEVLLVVQFDSLPIHVLRLSYATEEPAKFALVVDGKVTELNLSVQCSFLMGVERISSLGLSYTSLDDFESLYTVATSMCN